MMTVIQACYSVWNEETRIGLSLASIHPYVDRIIVIDGRYEGFCPTQPVESTDQTRQVAERYPKVKYVQLHTPLRPANKRQLYFQHPADWYLVIDADEVLFGGRIQEAFQKVKQSNGVEGYLITTYPSLRQLMLQRPIYFARLIHQDANFQYGDYHWHRLNGDGENMDDTSNILRGVALVSLNELCPKWRQMEKWRWMSWRHGKGKKW